MPKRTGMVGFLGLVLSTSLKAEKGMGLHVTEKKKKSRGYFTVQEV